MVYGLVWCWHPNSPRHWNWLDYDERMQSCRSVSRRAGAWACITGPFDAPSFSGPVDLDQTSTNQLFHASAAGSSTAAQPTMPAWKDSWQSFGCVFLLKFSPCLVLGEIRESNFWVVNSMVLDGFADLLLFCFYSMFSLVLVFVSMFSSFGFFVSMFDCFMARSMCPVKEWIPASTGMENKQPGDPA